MSIPRTLSLHSYVYADLFTACIQSVLPQHIPMFGVSRRYPPEKMPIPKPRRSVMVRTPHRGSDRVRSML